MSELVAKVVVLEGGLVVDAAVRRVLAPGHQRAGRDQAAHALVQPKVRQLGLSGAQ